jgi:hypothetical protein
MSDLADETTPEEKAVPLDPAVEKGAKALYLSRIDGASAKEWDAMDDEAKVQWREMAATVLGADR